MDHLDPRNSALPFDAIKHFGLKGNSNIQSCLRGIITPFSQQGWGHPKVTNPMASQLVRLLMIGCRRDLGAREAPSDENRWGGL